jgi:hypothetical protein
MKEATSWDAYRFLRYRCSCSVQVEVHETCNKDTGHNLSRIMTG